MRARPHPHLGAQESIVHVMFVDGRTDMCIRMVYHAEQSMLNAQHVCNRRFIVISEFGALCQPLQFARFRSCQALWTAKLCGLAHCAT